MVFGSSLTEEEFDCLALRGGDKRDPVLMRGVLCTVAFGMSEKDLTHMVMAMDTLGLSSIVDYPNLPSNCFTDAWDFPVAAGLGITSARLYS